MRRAGLDDWVDLALAFWPILPCAHLCFIRRDSFARAAALSSPRRLTDQNVIKVKSRLPSSTRGDLLGGCATNFEEVLVIGKALVACQSRWAFVQNNS